MVNVMLGPISGIWNSLDTRLKYCKTAKHFRNKFKSSPFTVIRINFASFWYVFCFFLFVLYS